MNYVSIFLVSFFVAFSGALAPGPFLAAVIHESAKQGAKAGLFMILGHVLLEVTMLAVIIFGFIHFIRSAMLIKFISLAGSGILIYLGIEMLRTISNLTFDLNQQNNISTNLALKGVTMSIANPYWTIWWLTIGLGLVLSAKKIGFYAIIVFFIGHILADFLWYSFVSILIDRNKSFISGPVYKFITSLCAFLLIGFGVYFAITSATAAISLQHYSASFHSLIPV